MISDDEYPLLGYDDEPLGVVRTTEVQVVRAGDVDEQFARDEAEGFETVAAWRAAPKASGLTEPRRTTP